MERGTESAKRQAKEEVPGDRIKDAPALARELRWRARHASGYSSDDDSRSSRRSKSAVNGGEPAANGIGSKRKRHSTDNGDEGTELFRNFKRPIWERVEEWPTERESERMKARKPDETSEGWLEEWTSRTGKGGRAESGEDDPEAHVERRRDVIVKVRRTEKGLERQRVERILEEWAWDESPSAAVLTTTPTTTTEVKTEPPDVPMTDESHSTLGGDGTHEETKDEDATMGDADAPSSTTIAVTQAEGASEGA